MRKYVSMKRCISIIHWLSKNHFVSAVSEYQNILNNTGCVTKFIFPFYIKICSHTACCGLR